MTGCSGGRYGTLQVRVTPSTTIGAQESNSYTGYRLSTTTDSLRNASEATWHGQVIGRVVNGDQEHLVALDGFMTLPEGMSAVSVTIHQNVIGYPLVTTAVVSFLNSTDFQVTGLNLDPGEEVLVAVELNAPVGCDLTKMRLDARFGTD